MAAIDIPKKQIKGWLALNDALRTASEIEALALLKEEKKGSARHDIMKRIYARYSRMRREREHAELLQIARS